MQPARSQEIGDSSRTWTQDPDVTWVFSIDIVGGCNLRCPSCPVGNSTANQPTANMSPELLERIVKKATSECPRLNICFYNWTEPFLHPELPKLIRIVKSYGHACTLSTNLNLMKNIDGIMEANPTKIKVSLSGFTQDRYGVTHSRGDIEVVKKNMAELARAKARAGSTTHLVVPFHRYLGNHEDEKAMKQYAESIGFEFEPIWAYLMPQEKVLAYADPDATDVKLTEDDHRLIDSLALPLKEALEISRNTPQDRCKLRDSEMALTSNGDVMLCCTVYDQSKFKLGSYLNTPLDQLQAMKFRHNACESCMANGIHVLATYGTKEYDRIALENVARHYPDARTQRAG